MDTKKLNILITGATGFIGMHLLQEIFSSDNNFNIKILSRKDSPLVLYSDRINIFKGDLSDISSIEQAFSDVDILINIAAENYNKEKFESTNISGVKNIITLASKYGIKKIIHLSSVGVVGEQYSIQSIIVTEDTKCYPKNGYERTKLESEKLLLDASSKNKFELVILRPTNVFGDFHPKCFLLNFLSHLKNKKLLFFTKNSFVNYVYVKDVAYAILYFISSNSNEKIINIGGSIKLSEFINIASELLKVAPRLFKLQTFIIRVFETINYFGISKVQSKFHSISNAVEYSDKRFISQIGYKYGIKAGLKQTIEYYNTNGKL